jgi:hypothetical protein
MTKSTGEVSLPERFENSSELLRLANDYNASYDGVLKSNNAARDSYQEKAREALYANLAQAYALVCIMLDKANAKVVADVLQLRGATPKREGVNPFFPCVKALYGKEKNPVQVTKRKKVTGTKAMVANWEATDSISTWVPNRSAYKYANVFRLAKQRGISPAMFKHWLLTFDDDEFGGGLTAAERRDRKLNGGNDPAADEALAAAVKLVVEQPSIGTIDLGRVEIADLNARFICIWGTVDAKEQFHAMGELPGSSDRVIKHLERTAPKRAEVLRAAQRLLAVRQAQKETPKIPAKPKTVKVGGKVQVEKQEVAHA